ncbi:hypothetical protein [Leptolyngbya sp. FACHB-261]|uniref:hypothetical protein n=1 Tax=Leptolyngbya sp. FACHB-261 TaxID=2692806 RepID=UPI001682B812|nr:hypothetical protein [Leptolyngbya sp. FACHB-261]MBD2101044.1 hypothetical protein [Leptolyngbya sp. FACHB-261]
MPDLHWFTIALVALALTISGGIGALIYAAISAYRNRKPRIGRRVDNFPSFEDTFGASCLRSQITVSDGRRDYKYEDLHVVQVQIANQSRQDFGEYELGITLSSGDVAIYIEGQTPDRQHLVKQLKPLTFAEPQSELDLALRPFNRDDLYQFRLLVVTSEGGKEPGPIELTSPQACQLIDMPTVKEAVKEAAKSTSLSVGPFQISFD